MIIEEGESNTEETERLKKRKENNNNKKMNKTRMEMETQMDAGISRDGRWRQRCGSVPALIMKRREKNRAKFGNLRKCGQEMG